MVRSDSLVYRGTKLLLDQFNLDKHTHPRMAKAGSSWRSNGKSRRKRVLKRAVMVSEEKEDQESFTSRSQEDVCIEFLTFTNVLLSGISPQVRTESKHTQGHRHLTTDKLVQNNPPLYFLEFYSCIIGLQFLSYFSGVWFFKAYN